MKKIIFSLVLLGSGLLADDTASQAMIENTGNGLNAGAAVGGLLLVHATAIVPVIMFAVAFAIIVGFYMMKFEQKDRGMGKTIAAMFVGVIVGYFAHYAAYKAFDGIWGDGCSSKISAAYFKDVAKKGLNPTQPFGTTVIGVVDSCSN